LLFKHSKKAMTIRVIAMVVLLLLSSTALIASQLHLFSSGVLEDEALPCRVMIEGQDLTDGSVFLNKFQNECQTIRKQLPLDKKTETVSEVQDELAQLMTTAWWTFKEGQVRDLWKDDHLGIRYNCVVRYTVDFNTKNAATNNLHIARKQFIDYLNTTKYAGADDESTTYLTYLTWNSGKPVYLAVLPHAAHPDTQYIDTNKTYAISLMSIHKGSFFTSIFNPAGFVVGSLANFLPTTLVFSTLDFAQNQLNCKTIQAKTY